MTSSPVSVSPARAWIALLCATSLTTWQARPALAEPPPSCLSIWGYSGLILVPTASIHGFRDYSVGATLLTKEGLVPPVGYVTAGIFEGLETGVLYGVPATGFTGLSGHAKYQLVRPTRDRPTGVAVGLSLIGVGGPERYVDGNNAYMVLSQDFNVNWKGQSLTWLVGHFGFQANLSFGARLMGGFELPLGESAALVGDVLGPIGTVQRAFFNVGATYRPARDWQLRLYSMGNEGVDMLDRDYGLSLSYTGNFLGNLQGGAEKAGPQPPTRQPAPAAVVARPTSEPTARPTPEPTAKPTPPPSPTPAPPEPTAPPATPTPAPSPTPEPAGDPTGLVPVRGSVLDDKGRPLVGWSVAVKGEDARQETGLDGQFRLQLPLGPYELVVRDPQGAVMLTKPIRLVTTRGLDLPLAVAVPAGGLTGAVLDGATRQGLKEAKVRLVRAGQNLEVESRADGTFSLSDVAAGDYRVLVTRARYRPYEGSTTVVARRDSALQVVLQPRPGSLSGRVTTPKNQGLAGVSVALPGLGLEALTDRSGLYRFPEVSPGQHKVVFKQGPRQLATSVVRVAADEAVEEHLRTTPSEDAATRGGMLAGNVVDAAGRRPLVGAKVVVESKDLTVLTITGPDGTFRVTDLPPGRYRVSVSRPGFAAAGAQATVTREAGAHVTVPLTATR
ncbi:MAG: carboxypeptidase regulatory-like domain-containing protein [Candidatus Sericytochromatia bacterium]|nr:carboxypeptidase regulatory-like domain-containing protein [Candidatus Sericytochromatia bacterium]